MKELAAGDRRDDPQIVVRRATLMLDSDLDPDPGLFLNAARTAIRLDAPLAERLARAAVATGGGMESQLAHSYCLVWQGRAADAEVVYREDLKRNPGNGWSLFGLSQSLGAQGKMPEAGRADELFRQAWARADVTITASRF